MSQTTFIIQDASGLASLGWVSNDRENLEVKQSKGKTRNQRQHKSLSSNDHVLAEFTGFLIFVHGEVLNTSNDEPIIV